MLQRILAVTLSLCMMLEAMPLRAIAETMPENAQIQEETFREDLPETTVPEETIPETTVPEETIPETSAPEETIPETTVPEETEPAEPDEETVDEAAALDAAEDMGFQYRIRNGSDGTQYVSITKYIGGSTELEVPGKSAGCRCGSLKAARFQGPGSPDWCCRTA